jgi:hypothetical protein
VYSRIVKKHTTTAATAILLLFPLFAGAEPRVITLGLDDGWGDLIEASGISFVEGKYGYLDAVLSDRIEDSSDAATATVDMHLRFDRSLRDDAGNYRLVASSAGYDARAARRGEGGAVLTGSVSGIVYEPEPGAAMAPGKSWDDLTIEFWLYPVLLSDGATVFRWDGARTMGESITLESIRVSLVGRSLHWEFINVFTPADFSKYTLKLSGTDPLIPKRWRHHLFRFDGETGVAEYLIDGVAVAITHATSTGRESREIYLPDTGNSDRTTIAVGADLHGFLDEFRVSESFVEEPMLRRYRDGVNRLVTRVFDLEFSNSRLVSIRAEYAEPDDSAVLFYFRTGERLAGASAVSGAWTPVLPGSRLPEVDRGRYFQLLAELYPDGDGETSPTINSVTIEYEPDLPPHPPERIRTVAGDGSIRVGWNRSLDPDVAGYLVYYGYRSMWYFGDDAAEGVAPIDVGNVDTVTLTGLENGRLYYITVVAYDSGPTPHRSEFPPEVSARPSRIAGRDTAR